jgi:REP element-mobilizing transposase RayT
MTWNNTDIPLAYLITFRCYGTWLHGDPRGSIDRFHNSYRSQYIPANYQWSQHNSSKLKLDPVNLDAERRDSVERAIRATCDFRTWHLRAVNVRTNHVHAVITAVNTSPEKALNALKANATRQMRQDGCWINDRSPWADKGSCRKLWNERSIVRAIDYVVNGQGGPLPDFD